MFVFGVFVLVFLVAESGVKTGVKTTTFLQLWGQVSGDTEHRPCAGCGMCSQVCGHVKRGLFCPGDKGSHRGGLILLQHSLTHLHQTQQNSTGVNVIKCFTQNHTQTAGLPWEEEGRLQKQSLFFRSQVCYFFGGATWAEGDYLTYISASSSVLHTVSIHHSIGLYEINELIHVHPYQDAWYMVSHY